MANLSDLPNIGKVAEAKLMAAGIDTPEALRKAGSKEAFLRVRLHSDPEACLSMLYGLEGAVEGIRWHGLSQSKRKELKAFFDSL